MGWWSPWSSGSTSDPEGHSVDSRPASNDSTRAAPTPSRSSDSSTSSKSTDWNSILNAFDWSQWKEPGNLVPTILLTGGILLVYDVHRRFLRRIPEATDISSSYLRRRSLLGYVTSVGDGDNFRMYHTPGGRLVGWSWLPWMKVPTLRKELKDRTIHIRLAGVDAPELPHFGRPAQPFSEEAHSWLTSYLLNRRVRAHVLRHDQYRRVIATVYVRNWLDFPPLRRRDVSQEMLKRGLATVYEAKTGVEFGSKEHEHQYREAEKLAKARKQGIWVNFGRKGGNTFESPREYKTRMGLEHPFEAPAKPEPDESRGILASIRSTLFPFRKKGSK
ncbi:staphylococcal nuclease domain protein [Talaromyces proteolyticus]|uniref:Probable endonuclease LCL3 n=1 Tax=Talaromyces proteolyticus TaxID=1131652 RepID=A0AAD4KV99_9EURO|nr:staphylococcal nuclease domain protein [Talaromyces proteolyticus]KAH8700629.1 staphylococcal nuclease domain protein [Talaromyces proteolyticus]